MLKVPPSAAAPPELPPSASPPPQADSSIAPDRPVAMSAAERLLNLTCNASLVPHRGGNGLFRRQPASTDGRPGRADRYRVNPVRAGTLGALCEGRPRPTPTCDLGSPSHTVESLLHASGGPPLLRISGPTAHRPEVFQPPAAGVSGPSLLGTAVNSRERSRHEWHRQDEEQGRGALRQGQGKRRRGDRRPRPAGRGPGRPGLDRKSTRLNSSHAN